jgi:hypothetical protein
VVVRELRMSKREEEVDTHEGVRAGSGRQASLPKVGGDVDAVGPAAWLLVAFASDP